MIRLIAFAAASLFVALNPPAAMAQWNNAPFEFRRAGPGSAVGMSPAYRQAILEAELLGKRPRSLVRDRNGLLIEAVKGPSGQAFLREQAQPFLPSVTGFGFGVAGVSVGSSGAGRGLGYAATDSAALFIRWSGMVGGDDLSPDWNGAGGATFTPASVVIESWIAQLPSVEP